MPGQSKTAIQQNTGSALFNKFRPVLRNWWFLLTAGLFLIGIGICVIYSPFQTYLTISWVLPPAMVGTGVLDIMFAWTNRHSKRWVWWLLAGLADVLLGVYLFDNQLVTILLLPVLVGLWTWYKGLIALGDAWHIRSYGMGNWRRLLLSAVIAVVMAGLVLSCRFVGLENIFLLSGLAFIAAGIYRVLWALRMRRIAAIMTGPVQAENDRHQ